MGLDVVKCYKKYFRSVGNKPMWHECCRVVKAWPYLKVEKQESIVEKLLINFPKINLDLYK